MLDAPLSDPVPSTNECWDLVYDWTDNVGDSCVWYSQGNNCLYYGDEFPCTTDGNANLVCCTCGGGCTTPPLLGDYIEEIPGCSDSPAHWTDVDNDGCDWYAEDDNCQVFESGYAGEDGKTANEACCFCGGGYDPNAPRIVPNITTPCTDVLDWTDSGGDPCSWYETDDHCFRFGTANAGPDGSTAVESCCVCGGGAAPLCSDKADWTDLEGDPCSWYEIEDRCLQFGIANAGIDGTTASESCCVCGGSAPVCNDKAGWTDSFGDGCVWYLYGNHCDVYGNANEGEDGTTARESCCGCGGGEVQSDSCFDTPGWVDGAQDDCSWYELDGRCTTFGGSDVVASAVDGTTANEACCVCGGGSSGSTVAVAAAEAKSAQTKKKTKGWLGWLPGGFEP
ncbi:expressed unknown protein [Seminavis robusta]|uniref:Uncharacterized protein n=1 Tax=Seminavis robusta TaxID=568900 RepID=A0A9N8HHH7_9STRA|nr:expressed unknown protein [Seminavis robusta]|eukprot:Sro563_g167230.1 n/a (394) ;mRNA; f:38978-40159